VQEKNKLRWDVRDIRISTIDSYQGQESDIVIFNCVRANNFNSIGFLKDYRRINVGLTRAKFFLFIVGNSNTLNVDPVWNELIKRLMRKPGHYQKIDRRNLLI
jgi:regulator of nonsense transcripts 1